MNTYAYYTIMKEGCYYSFKWEDWFDKFMPSCLGKDNRVVAQIAKDVGGEVVQVKVEVLLY